MPTPQPPPPTRLYLQRDPNRPLPGALAAVAPLVARQAAGFARSIVVPYAPDLHNSLLLRAREAQRRLVTVAVQWRRTGERRLRDAVVAYADQIGNWEFWAWEAWRSGDRRPAADFDLSHGENSATLALAWDLLGDALTRPERRIIRDHLRRWCVEPFLAATGKERAKWWFKRDNSNWNTVCAGGPGMVALALGDELAEGPAMLARVETSIAPYMRHLDATDGGWPEGLGYWNYGMRYAFMYLLSHERATGRRHPLLHRAATRKTLAFPLDFTPYGQVASFGDVSTWGALPMHLGAAVALGETTVQARLDPFLQSRRWDQGCWPDAAELLCLHPGEVPQTTPTSGPVNRLYRGLGWGLTSDEACHPRLFAAVRGGTSKVPHSHQDLLDLAVIVGGETLVRCASAPEYMDTTFSSRRWSLWELTPQAKNTVLINGVGVLPESAADIRPLRVGRHRGFRLDATAAMGASRGELPVADCCLRTVLRLGARALLVVDHVEMPSPGRIEQRWLTPAALRPSAHGGIISGRRARLHLAYAADVPCTVSGGDAPLTTPSQPASRLLRVCTVGRTHRRVTIATVLSAAGAATIALAQRGRRLTITISGRGWRERVSLTDRLGAPRD